MKHGVLVLLVSLALGQTAKAAETVTSAGLVARLLQVIEDVKTLNSTCVFSVSASTNVEEFVAVTLKDERSGASATLTLKSSSGRIAKTVSGDAVVTQTYTTSKGYIALSSYEDMADLSIDLKSGADTVSCKFSE